MMENSPCYSSSRVASPTSSATPRAFERSLNAADTTLHQLTSAKETFTDLETAYKKFKYELETVKEEHNMEVGLPFLFINVGY